MGMAQAARSSAAADTPALRARARRCARAARGLAADGGQPRLGAGDRCDEVIGRRRPARRAARGAGRARAPHSRRRGRALPRDGAARRRAALAGRAGAHALQRGRARDGRLRLGARRRARGARARSRACTSGSTRRARLLQGARLTAWELAAGRHPAHADRRRRGRAAVRARARRRRRLRRRPHRAQRRRGQQDRLVHALGARASPTACPATSSRRPRRSTTRSRAARRSRSRSAPRTRSRRLAGRALAPAGTAVANPAFDVTPAANITAIVTEARRAPRAVRAEPARRGRPDTPLVTLGDRHAARPRP